MPSGLQGAVMAGELGQAAALGQVMGQQVMGQQLSEDYCGLYPLGPVLAFKLLDLPDELLGAVLRQLSDKKSKQQPLHLTLSPDPLLVKELGAAWCDASVPLAVIVRTLGAVELCPAVTHLSL
ncbi:hypothetical protein HaLaN_24079, partial [Haematococcus lacustris]